MAESTTITSRLMGGLPHFLGSLRKLIGACGSNAVDHAAFGELLEFKSLVAVARKLEEPWLELWQSPELLWSGPNTLLQSVPQFIDLCDELLTTDCNSSLLAAAVQAHLAVFRGWLEHATPVQRAQLTPDRCMRLLWGMAGAAFEAFPLLSVVYDIQEALVDFGPALFRLALSGCREQGKAVELQELPAVGHTLLQAATDALWLTSTIMLITSSPRLSASISQLSGIVHGLSEWARVLKGAEACAWWQQDPVSLELPMLLAELTLAYCEGQKLRRQQQQDTLDGQPDLLAFVVRSSLQYLRAELEKSLQEPGTLQRSYSLLNSKLLRSWLVDCATADESMLDLWLQVLSMTYEAAAAQLRPWHAAAGRPADSSWEQLKWLVSMRSALLDMHRDLLRSAWQLNARAAQLLEAAALKCASAMVKELWAVCDIIPFPEPDESVTTSEPVHFLLSSPAILLARFLKLLALLEAPALSSPAARLHGAPRPPGALAVAAALDAVRLGEAVLRYILGTAWYEFVQLDSAIPDLECHPATLCTFALNVISKWATGKLPAASGSQPELYLLQLTRGKAGLDALLSLLATQGKLAQEMAQGLPMVAEDAWGAHYEGLHHSLWTSVGSVSTVALSLASRSSSSSTGGGSGGRGSGGESSSSECSGIGREMHISREKEAVVCLAITAAKHLASATPSHIAGAEIFVQLDRTVMISPFMGLVGVLQSFSCNGMLPSALRLGAAELLDDIVRSHLELLPSARAAPEVVRKCVTVFLRIQELLPAMLHGGLLRHAAEAYLAWLQTDAFQVVKANRRMLDAMQLEFSRICEAAEGHLGLHGKPYMVQGDQLLMGDGCGFIKPFPKTKKERAQAKEKLLRWWTLRAQQLCPKMERAARAAVRAELAPAPGAECVPEVSQRPLVGAQAPTSLAAAIEAAHSAAAMALVKSSSEHMAQEVEGPRGTEAGMAAQAEAAVPLGLRQAAVPLGLRQAAEPQHGQQQRGQVALDSALERMQELPVGERICAAAHAHVAATEAAEGTPGSGGSAPAVTNDMTGPTAQRMSSCPVSLAIRDIAVSRAGCANACCRNLSGASESELPRLFCRGCLSVRYCSEECGRGDWPRPPGASDAPGAGSLQTSHRGRLTTLVQ